MLQSRRRDENVSKNGRWANLRVHGTCCATFGVDLAGTGGGLMALGASVLPWRGPCEACGKGGLFQDITMGK